MDQVLPLIVGGALLLLLTLGIVATLVAVTWFTFPAAEVVRALPGGDRSRWVRKALGPGVSVRDLGEVNEAEWVGPDLALRVVWTSRSTQIHVERGVLSTDDADAWRTLHTLGVVDREEPLQWSAARPPDPQLQRVILAIRDLASR